MVKYKDIADHCGVSLATVSYAMNGKGSISPAVRQKIMSAAEEMGYESKTGALPPKKLIRLFCADLETLPTHLFFNELLAGIFSVTVPSDYDVIVTPVLKDSSSDRIKMSPRMLGDGVLVINPRDNEDFLQDIEASGIPLLVIGRPGSIKNDICYVDVDNEAVGYQMTKHLLERGHRSILFVNGPEDYTISQDRLNGYKMALADFNVEFNPNLVLNCSFTVDGAYTAVSHYLQNISRGATGMIVNDDSTTIGSLNALTHRGIRVPEDCSVICGGESTLVKMYPTPITGIDLHHEQLGACAARMLLDLINKTLIRVTHYHVPFDLNDRGSTKKNTAGGGHL